jgi:hypothetical protein
LIQGVKSEKRLPKGGRLRKIKIEKWFYGIFDFAFEK